MDSAPKKQKTLPDNEEKNDFTYLSQMYKENFLTDVTFIVGEPGENTNGESKQRRFQCHKIVFAAKSPVFKAMFGELFSQSNEITIPDVDVTSFQTVIKYVYTGKIEMDEEHLLELMYTVEKYSFTELKEAIEVHFMANLALDTFFQFCKNGVYWAAVKFNLNEFVDHYVCFIRQYIWKLVQKEEFDQLDYYDLEFILKENYLNVPEHLLFDAVIKWARADCAKNSTIDNPTVDDLRQSLDDLIYLIRFASMTKEEFMEGLKNNVFDSNEIWHLIQHFFSGFSYTVETEFISKFVKQKRSCYNGRSLKLGERWSRSTKLFKKPNDLITRIRFMADLDCVLFSIGINGYKLPFTAKNFVIYKGNSILMFQSLVDFKPQQKSAEAQKCFYNFDKNVVIQANEWHEIEFQCIFDGTQVNEYEETSNTLTAVDPALGTDLRMKYEQNESIFEINELCIYWSSA